MILTNTTWLQIKYANLLSSRLDKFRIRRQNPFLANFRCHLCGDSQKHRNKARGYLYEKDNRLYYTCHNCGAGRKFNEFLSEIDVSLYNDYIFEIIAEKKQSQEPEFVPDIGKFVTKRFQQFSPLKELSTISQLRLDHPARKYVTDRRIPSVYHHKLYYAPKFAKWVNSIVPDKFDSKVLAIDEPRLILPLIDQQGYCFGFQGRSFRKGDNVLRYITIMLDESKPKIFGLDTVDPSRVIYVLEGPIDSMFVPNSVAMVGADIQLDYFANPQNQVFIYDNQPRNSEVVKRIEKTIKFGSPVVIWPALIVEKDINDMIMAGMSSDDIMGVINRNTYSGLEAQMMLNAWKRV